jgi:hypothetical protein
MNAKYYIDSIQQITALKCPREIKEKKDKDGRTYARIPQPWKLIDYRENDDSVDIALRVPLGYSCKDLLQHIDAIYAVCGAYVKIRDRAGVAQISIGKKDFPTLIPFTADMLTMTTGKTVLIGFDQLGNPVTHNFRVPHMLVGSSSGYGKTDLIRLIMLQLISRFTPDELRIDIVDGKGFSFMPFRGIPHIRRIVRDVAGSASIMSESRRIMNERSDIVWNSNERGKTKGFQWRMVIIDELGVLSPHLQVTSEDKQIATKAYADMAAVACVGREANVGVIVCTQRPDVNTVHPSVKQNMDVSIAFRTKTASNSEIIIDHPGAEKLPHKTPGRGIYAASTDTIFHSPFVGPDEEKDLTNEDRAKGLTSWETVLAPYKYPWNFDKEVEHGTETDDINDVQ